MSIKRITILHANDLHGQLSFKLDKTDMLLHGGISMTADYVKRTRREVPTFFGICGDVLQEDVWGSDYKGTNTVSLVNMIHPDALSLGNHELDYGLAHLLIFKECIQSDVLCANLMVDKLNIPLFTPSKIYEVGGVRLLVIGVIPEAFFKKIMSDAFCRDMISYKDSYVAIREEIAMHKDEADIVVLMSHYGIEGDRTLAAELPNDIHLDLLLGGHTHIDMDEAEVVNGIPIAQSSYGTTHIGRFDLAVDVQAKRIAEWSWQRVPITEENCSTDEEVDELADKVVFAPRKPKNTAKLGEFTRELKNESRLYETELGDVVADAFADIYGVDFVILQSGSLRSKACGPVVTEEDLKRLYPFDDAFMEVPLSGAQLRKGFEYLFTLKEDGSVMNGTFQYSRGFKLVADFTDCWKQGCRIEELKLMGEPIAGERIYRVGVTRNCLASFLRYFGYLPEEGSGRILSISTFSDLARWLIMQPGPVNAPAMGRFIIHNFEA